MKKVVTAVVLFTLMVTPALSISAQKTRNNLRKADQTIVPVSASASTQSSFDKVEAYSDGRNVLVRWAMKQEVNNFGFNIYRVDSDGEQRVTENPVLGAATRFHAPIVDGQTYEFLIEGRDRSGVYTVEAVGMDGSRLRADGIVPTGVRRLNLVSSQPLVIPRDANIESKELELPRDLFREVESYSVAPDPTVHRSVISRPGVKLGVKGEGIFRVTRAQLQAGGFDVNGDSSKWQLYVNGIEQAISIGPNADYIEFYGVGVDTIESDIQTYYLITGDTAGKRIQNRISRPSTSTVISNNFADAIVRKERTNYLSTVLNGQAENWFGRVIFDDGVSYPLVLNGADPNGSDATIKVGFLGYSFTSHVMEVSVNGHAITAGISAGQQQYSTTMTIPASWLIDGSNNLQMRSAGSGNDISFFDYVQVSYSRKYAAAENQLKFFTPNNKKTNVVGFTSANVRVFDITDINQPSLYLGVPIQQDGATFTATLPAARGRVFYAVEDTAIKSVQSVIPNDTAILASPANGANLVIIAHSTMMQQAQAWADYRRSQGITVTVVEASEIYDEFNYGVLSSESVKSFLAYASANWQTAPGYVLMIGDASFDSRNYGGTGYFNMVPTKFVDTIFSEIGSDEALVDFNNDGLAEMAIGRIPVRNPQDAANILARQITWEAAISTPLTRGAVLASDVFDATNNYDFEAMSAAIRNSLPAGTPVTMANRSSPTGQADLITALNTGPYLVNYSGHGSTGVWAATSFFWNGNVPQLVNAPASRPIYTMLTCLNGYFMNQTFDSLAEILLKSNNGGAISAWASTGETTPDVQQTMALRFYTQIGSGPANLNRLGDLIRDAKAQIPGGADVRLSWALLGDPMLKVK